MAATRAAMTGFGIIENANQLNSVEGRRRKNKMPRQLVEVIGRDGHVIESHIVEVPHGDCVEAEFEEIALVLTERSGRVAEAEHIHLRARCVK